MSSFLDGRGRSGLAGGRGTPRYGMRLSAKCYITFHCHPPGGGFTPIQEEAPSSRRLSPRLRTRLAVVKPGLSLGLPRGAPALLLPRTEGPSQPPAPPLSQSSQGVKARSTPWRAHPAPLACQYRAFLSSCLSDLGGNTRHLCGVSEGNHQCLPWGETLSFQGPVGAGWLVAGNLREQLYM